MPCLVQTSRLRRDARGLSSSCTTSTGGTTADVDFDRGSPRPAIGECLGVAGTDEQRKDRGYF